MFAGLRLESRARSTSNTDSTHVPLDRAMGKAGVSGAAPGAAVGVASAGDSSCWRLGRRPGYLREQEEGRRAPVKPAHHRAPLTSPLPSVSPGGQLNCHRTPSVSYQELCGPAPSDRPVSSGPAPSDRPASCSQAHSPCVRDSPAPSAGDQFTSSFSFIRLSLTSDPRSDCSPPSPPRSPLGPVPALPEQSVTMVTDKCLGPAGGQWISREGRGDPAVTPELKELPPDSDSCSLSVDSSDSASASSLTSGYESAPRCASPRGEGWDALLKRYEGVLQDCLHSSRRNAQIEAMMLKLQRLQQKAVLEDDYDTAEHFGQKLEELWREKTSLQLGLPSQHPTLSHLLLRLQGGVSAALQDTARSCSGERQEVTVEEKGRGLAQDPAKRREQLLQEQKLVQEETQVLRCRLQELQERGRQLGVELQQEERLEEGLGPALRGCSPAQLQELSRALDDLITSKHRAQICTHPPPPLLRLKEQEAALKACIKETTAKVVMTQRLGGGLRRRVSTSEAQLLALHEAKLAAISGSDFSSAKALKAELRVLSGERERLESLARRLQALSAGNSRDLARIKSEHGLLQQDLERRQAQYESTQRENTLKYIELLEDKLHSCSNSLLERVWEADLEACHLLLRVPSCCGTGREEASPSEPRPEQRPEPCPQSHPEPRLELHTEPRPEPHTEPRPEPHTEPHLKQEQDCAMLTALGGRWCAETGLQHSEFTKKLEEFLFCMEDCQDPCDVTAEVTEVTEQCELIGRRLDSLDKQLQKAILDRDPVLAQSLQEEVQEVKATLQAMLRHLEEEEDDDMEEREGEEDEDHYFSDSWI